MGEREILSGYEGKLWEIHDEVISNMDEVDVTIQCECGNEFNMYLPYTAYKCVCGKIYRSVVSVELSLEESS